MKSLTMLFLSVLGTFAQVPEYLPLQPGNQWIYRTSGGAQQVVSVARQETVAGNTYSVLTGFGAESWVRASSDGVLVSYDRNSRTERPYLDFTAREKTSFPTSAHPCNTTAEIESKAFRGSFPLGEFSSIAAIRYGGNVCADAGITADYYLPYIGLLRRMEITLAGPRTYDLTYARINGTVMISTHETTFSLTTDKAVYLNTTSDIPVLTARMTLRHSDSTDPLVLEIGTSQEVDYILTDRTGKTIFKWSDGQAFTQALTTLRINQERNWVVSIPLKGLDGKVLSGGTYQLEGLVTTLGGARYRAQVTIEVAEVRPAMI